MSDEVLKELARSFQEELRAMLTRRKAELDAAGIAPREQVMVLAGPLIGAAAQVAQAAKMPRESFESMVKAIGDREYQGPVDPGVTTRQRGSA